MFRSSLRLLPRTFKSTPLYTRTFTSAFLDRSEVTSRILDVIKKFASIDAAKVNKTSHFSNDLGLDSLDQVELVMSIEEEFKIEISDADAERILSVEDAVKYIAAHASAK